MTYTEKLSAEYKTAFQQGIRLYKQGRPIPRQGDNVNALRAGYKHARYVKRFTGRFQ